MFDINDNLYYEKIKWYNKHILLNSIATVLNIDKKTIDLYNSNYTLFTNKIKKNIIFNTYYKLEKLISPDIGLINNKEVPIYIKKISFLKDDYELIDLFNNPKYKNTQYFFDKIHNINAPANVEIFINSFTSGSGRNASTCLHHA
jgi:hypothetical protein